MPARMRKAVRGRRTTRMRLSNSISYYWRGRWGSTKRDDMVFLPKTLAAASLFSQSHRFGAKASFFSRAEPRDPPSLLAQRGLDAS